MTTREPGIRDFSEDQKDTPISHQVMTDEETEEFLRQAREMVLTQEQRVRTAKREAELKGVLMKTLEYFGDPSGDSGQHRYLKFPRPIRGIAGFIRQTKVGIEVDETKAEAIARQRGIYDRLFKPVMQLDDSAVLVALEEGLLTETDVEEIFKRKVTYAFIAEKAKK
jgi:hypothetical protein